MTDLLGPANATNAVTTRPTDTRVFGSTDTWFKPCTTAAAQDGTQLQAVFFNGLLAQVRNLIRGNGLRADGVTPVITETTELDAMALSAVLQLVQRCQANYAVDTGTADVLACTPSTALVEYKAGMRFLVLKNPSVGANATTTPTINFGPGNLQIVKVDASALGAGDLKKGGIFEVEVDGAGNARLTSLLTISDILALTATTPVGKTLASKSVAGTYTFTVPAGVYWVYGTCVGAGAGGAGSKNGGTYSGAGGGAGGTAAGWIAVTPGQVIAYVVGAGGAGAAYQGSSTAGGTSSIGSIMQATGGGGTGNYGLAGGSGGVGSGGQLSYTGGCGNDGNSQNGAMPGGQGGASSLGGGGRTATNYVANVSNGQAPGSGGGGIYNTGANNNGGNGADGYVSFSS